MARWLHTRWEDEGGAGLEPTHLGAQGSHHRHEGASNSLGSKGHLKAMSAGIWYKSL
jgi:hypothetical protein